MHSGWIRMRCWFNLDFCPYIHGTAALALFAFDANFISISASVHGQECASFMVHLLLFHQCTFLVCLLLLLAFYNSYALSSHVSCAKPIFTFSQVSASSIWFVLARDGLQFHFKLICFSHRTEVQNQKNKRKSCIQYNNLYF